MGLFGDKEEKARRKEEKKEAYIRDFLDKYTFDTVSDKDLGVIIQIATDAWNNGDYDNVLLYAGSDDLERAIYEQLKALQRQNWMILNQLNKLNSNFEKLFNR